MAKRKTKKRSTQSMQQKLGQIVISLFVLFAASSAYWLTDHLSEVHVPEINSPVELYANQTRDDLTQTFAQAIGSAKESVLLLVYSLTDSEMIRQLKGKAEEGVPVQVICDAKASPYVGQKLGSQVQTLRRFAKGLMHLKILVIDQELIWIGSANMTGESLRVHGNLVQGLKSPELAHFIWQRAASMDQENQAGGAQFTQLKSGDQQIELWFLPNNTPALKRLIQLIRSAEKSVKVAMFTFTRYDLAHELIAAERRGVDVQVVIDHNSGKGASSKIVSLLASSGIPTALSTCQGLLHHKFAYIDDKILVNGSANWTKSAFVDNDDCFMVVDNLTEDQKQLMQELWKVIKYESQPEN